MKFHIEEIVLWMKNGNIRKLIFKPNKVNIITGSSNTGKTVIWEIIDYCFFSSRPRIPEKIINENVDWYGINFCINQEHYIICRKGMSIEGIPSNEYYFSGIGDLPEIPESNIGEDELKVLMDAEFGIHDKVIIPYGGKLLSRGSKISLRYFLLFNSQNENTIINSETFFDKQTEPRYREALERIFDLAIGIDTVEDTLIKEQINIFEIELKKLEKKIIAFDKENMIFERNMKEIIKQAKELGLVNDDYENFDEELNHLKKLVYDYTQDRPSTELNEYENLEKQQWEIIHKIKKLKKFEKEYNNYKEVIEVNYDSLKPISYIHRNYSEIIDVPLVLEFISNLNSELTNIKKIISKKSPVRIDVRTRISGLNSQLKEVQTSMDRHPLNPFKILTGTQEKFILIGEIKTKLEFYEKKWGDESPEKDIERLTKAIGELKRNLGDRDQKKHAVMRLLEDLIQKYLNQAGDALENYKGYKAAFDHKEKKLKLQEPNSTKVENIVGSSSNHLFLHLTLFLGLHELLIRQEIPYVPSFLFLDQPSRPYYDNKSGRINDRFKITRAIGLLNDFITHLNYDLNKDFQFIVVEHIPVEIWEDNNMDNVYLVEEFSGTNKLIREEDKMIL